MAMGKRKARQESLFITTDQLTPSTGHPFYQKLNLLLDEARFDRWIEKRCARYYVRTEKRGQPSLPPGVYFRMLLVGYFEGLDSQRGIAWRCSDSLSLRMFLGIPLGEGTPDHSTLTNTRKRLPEEVFEEVFRFVLGIAAAKKLIVGKTVGVDSTTLEANAAMKSIVRRDSGEDWKEYVIRLMREEGVIGADEKPSTDEVLRYDRKRKDKTVSNAEWKSATDEDAKITRMKDGTTHLAYKAEHVVDLASDLVLAAEIRPGTAADTATWADQPEEQRRAALNNRRRMGRSKGKAMQRRRSEVVERTFAHVCETGGSRRSHLRGLVNVTKRYLIAVAAHNLGRILRRLVGVGKPRALQGAIGGFVGLAWCLAALIRSVWARLANSLQRMNGRFRENEQSHPHAIADLPDGEKGLNSTGC